MKKGSLNRMIIKIYRIESKKLPDEPSHYNDEPIHYELKLTYGNGWESLFKSNSLEEAKAFKIGYEIGFNKHKSMTQNIELEGSNLIYT